MLLSSSWKSLWFLFQVLHILVFFFFCGVYVHLFIYSWYDQVSWFSGHWLCCTESSWGFWAIHRGWCPFWQILSFHGKARYMGRTYGVASSISCYRSEYLHTSCKFIFLICFCQMYVSEILLNNIWIQLFIWFKC